MLLRWRRLLLLLLNIFQCALSLFRFFIYFLDYFTMHKSSTDCTVGAHSRRYIEMAINLHRLDFSFVMTTKTTTTNNLFYNQKLQKKKWMHFVLIFLYVDRIQQHHKLVEFILGSSILYAICVHFAPNLTLFNFISLFATKKNQNISQF